VNAGVLTEDQAVAGHSLAPDYVRWQTGDLEHAFLDASRNHRTPGTRGFTPLLKRWTVERTYGWLMFHRRLARDYETLPTRSEAMIHLAMTDLMARRLAGEATISWRDPTPRDETQLLG
jgi:hypothetical protein